MCTVSFISFLFYMNKYTFTFSLGRMKHVCFDRRSDSFSPPRGLFVDLHGDEAEQSFDKRVTTFSTALNVENVIKLPETGTF